MPFTLVPSLLLRIRIHSYIYSKSLGDFFSRPEASVVYKGQGKAKLPYQTHRGDATVIAKYDKAPREGIELDYDATVASMTAEGSVTDDVLRDTRAELTKMSNPPDKDKLFDYSIVRKVYGELKTSGWQPKP